MRLSTAFILTKQTVKHKY